MGTGTAAGEQGGAAAGTGQAPPETVRPARPGRRSRGRLLRDFFLLVGLAGLFTVPATAFVAQAFLVPTGSLADTLRPGDRVLVNKLVSHLGGCAGATSWCSAAPGRGGRRRHGRPARWPAGTVT